VAAIVGLARAVELAKAEREEECRKLSAMRDRFEALILERIPDAVIHGRNAPQRAPHITNVSVPGTESESLLMGLDLRGIGCSAGSACQSGSVSPSHVLMAIGAPRELAGAALRISWGCLNNPSDVDRVADVFSKLVEKARGPAAAVA
jgi:cysteine desulfurase